MPRNVCNLDTTRVHRVPAPLSCFSPSLWVDKTTQKNLVPTGPTWIRGLERAACLTHTPPTDRVVCSETFSTTTTHTHPLPLVKRPASPCRAVVALMRLVAPLSAGPPRTHTHTHTQYSPLVGRRGVSLFVSALASSSWWDFLSLCVQKMELPVGQEKCLFLYLAWACACLLLCCRDRLFPSLRLLGGLRLHASVGR